MEIEAMTEREDNEYRRALFEKAGRWDLLTPDEQKVDDDSRVQDKQVGGSHYKDYAFQPWDIIDEYGLDFYEGCVLKYLLRNKDNRKQDLEKAIHCIEKIIEDINNEH
jgi:hypothetical protein